MIYKRNASDFMSSPVIVASKENSFQQLLDFFTSYKIQHLPIEEDGKLTGILTVNDIIRYLNEKLASGRAFNAAVLDNDFKIEDVMTPDPVCVSPDASQKRILDILAEGKFQAVPVVEDGLIKGIITNKDIARVYNYDISHVI